MQNQPTIASQFLSVKEASKELSTSRQTVYRLIREGILPERKDVRGKLFLSRNDLYVFYGEGCEQ